MSNTLAAPPIAPPRRRAGRWLRILTAFVILLFVLVAFAPAIIANTPLLNILVRKALADLNGTVAVGGASLGWFSPIELRDLRITDTAGQPVIAVPRIATSKSLWSLALSQSDIGEVAVEEPTLDITTEKGRTNFETVFAKYLEADGSAPSAERTAIQLRLTKGTIHFRDRNREIANIEAQVQVPASRTEPVKLDLKAGSSGAGSVSVEGSLGRLGQVKLKATDFPLDLLDPFLRRIDATLSLGGSLTTDITANWSDDFANLKVEGTSRVRDLDLTASWLGGDHLRLASVEMPVKIEGAGSTLKIEQASLTCDLGRASIAGEFHREGSFEKYFDKPGVAISAQVDLAKLVHALPRLTSLREGTLIESGSLTLSITSEATPEGTTWSGSVDTADVRALREGQPLEWREPLAITFRGRLPGGGLPVIESFVCRSDVIAMQARGTPESFKAAANIDLARFADRFGQFIHLGDGIPLEGKALVRAEVNRTPATGAFTVAGSVELTGISVVLAPQSTFRADKVLAKLEAAGSLGPNQPVRIDSGIITVTAPDDSLEVRLLEPVADLASLTSGRMSVKAATLVSRGKLAPLMQIPAAWQIEGRANLEGILRFDSVTLKCEGLTGGVANLVFVGEGLDIREPKATAEGSIAFHRKTGRIDGSALKLACASFSTNVPGLTIEPQPDGTRTISGDGTYTADLAAIERWFGLADPRGGSTLAGRAAGSFKLAAKGGVTEFQTSSEVKDFVMGPRTSPTWAEPTLRLGLEGALDPVRDELRLRQARVEREGLTLQAEGGVTQISSKQTIALKGAIGYDLAKLTPMLRGFVGGGFDAAGTGTKPFRLTGSLVPPGTKDVTFTSLTGDAGLNWQRVQAYGFDIGQGEMNARLERGLITFNRIDAKFGGGEVHVTPTIRLEPAPMAMSVEKGRIIEKASLTPKSCAGAIGYALPVVANALQADGQVSFTIAENSIPLADMTKTTMKGQLLVHKATVGTGPIISEIAKLLGASATSLTLANDMTVPIRVENGRVHHENLRLTVNGFAVTTNGSVGFDGSVSLIADVPVPANQLFKNNPRIMQALTNKTIKVPIAGTLAKPTLDPKGFQDAIAQLVKDATKSAATDLIKGGLEKLLTPKK